MKKFYKVNITINDGDNELTDEIIVNRVFPGFFYREIVTNKTFYPLYRFPVSAKQCLHNGCYMNGEDEIKRQLNMSGYSMIMFLDENKKIVEINDEAIIKDCYKDFSSSIFSSYIGKDIQKKKLKKRTRGVIN
ncbi:MAG: hypothetical protein IJR82_04725 [Bacilli bacterium]|nr:hypothetical protein [Bacilli bacterium]